LNVNTICEHFCVFFLIVTGLKNELVRLHAN
jgi:hypothetical protein